MVRRQNGLQVCGHSCYCRQPCDRFKFLVDFRQRCAKKLEHSEVYVAADKRQHGDAVIQYVPQAPSPASFYKAQQGSGKGVVRGCSI